MSLFIHNDSYLETCSLLKIWHKFIMRKIDNVINLFMYSIYLRVLHEALNVLKYTLLTNSDVMK